MPRTPAIATIHGTLSGVRRAAEKAAQASLARDAAIRKAHGEGATLRQIATAAGLTHARIHQIVRGK